MFSFVCLLTLVRHTILPAVVVHCAAGVVNKPILLYNILSNDNRLLFDNGRLSAKFLSREYLMRVTFYSGV